MKFYITKVKQGKLGNRFPGDDDRRCFVYAELKDSNNHTCISATLDYIVNAIERGTVEYECGILRREEVYISPEVAEQIIECEKEAKKFGWTPVGNRIGVY